VGCTSLQPAECFLGYTPEPMLSGFLRPVGPCCYVTQLQARDSCVAVLGATVGWAGRAGARLHAGKACILSVTTGILTLPPLRYHPLLSIRQLLPSRPKTKACGMVDIFLYAVPAAFWPANACQWGCRCTQVHAQAGSAAGGEQLDSAAGTRPI